VWEWTVQEYYAAQLCHRAETQPDWKTTNEVKLWRKEFSTAADVEWMIHWNELQRSVNNLWSCKYSNSPVTLSLLFITAILAASMGERDCDTVTAPFVECASTISSCASWVIHVLIGCRHLFIRYWQPLLGKTTVICSLPHPQKEYQRSINSFRSYIVRNQGIARIFAHIAALLTALIGKNTIYQRWNTDTELIDIANYTTCKSPLLVAENAILIRHY